MIEQKYKEIIDKLIIGTQNKRITWKKTERDTEFRTILGSSMVTTDNWLLDNGVECVDLGLWNSNGEIAGRIAYENNEKEGGDYQELFALYTIVKNTYYRVDETFDEILKNLNFDA